MEEEEEGVIQEKRKRMDTTNVVGMGEDKISNLPEALIHHILSFLPTKCAMSTCILSQKWKHLSNSIPTLDFLDWRTPLKYTTREEKKQETRSFMEFLDTVLFLHEMPNIQKFCLRLNGDFDEFQVYKWISILIKRKVKQLFLSLGLGLGFMKSFQFPLSFFTCDSLTVLELNRIKLNVPNTVCFPRLKLLRLKSIVFVNESSPNKLVSNSPILEEFSLDHCLLKSEVLCIANLALKHLNIHLCTFGESAVKICSPNLSTIRYGHRGPVDFVIGCFPSLVEADIRIYCECDGTDIYVLIKLFEKLANVKLLKLSGSTVQVLSEADILLTGSLTFKNLIHMEVSSPCTLNLRSFFRFLQLKPNLESILFDCWIEWIDIPDEEDDGCCSLDPKCPPPHLKSIKFNYLDGNPAELNAIKLFLKYFRFLETVTIVASPELSEDPKKQLNVAKLLLMFPKPADCVVKFLEL